MSTPQLIPNFLQASSKKGLVELMILNNAKKGAYHNYFSIVKDGASWVAWYYEEFKNFNNILTKISGKK